MSPPIINHLGPRDLQIMPLKLGRMEYHIFPNLMTLIMVIKLMVTDGN
jgi:hypothetical protein